jgi:hypothetical protein
VSRGFLEYGLGLTEETSPQGGVHVRIASVWADLYGQSEGSHAFYAKRLAIRTCTPVDHLRVIPMGWYLEHWARAPADFRDQDV